MKNQQKLEKLHQIADMYENLIEAYNNLQAEMYDLCNVTSTLSDKSDEYIFKSITEISNDLDKNTNGGIDETIDLYEIAENYKKQIVNNMSVDEWFQYANDL